MSSSSSNLKLNDSDKGIQDSKKDKKDKAKIKKSFTSKTFKSSASKNSLKSTISAPICNLPEYIIDQDLPENSNLELLPTDMSDSTDSEKEKMEYINVSECTSKHEGRQLVHTILPISKSKFNHKIITGIKL